MVFQMIKMEIGKYSKDGKIGRGVGKNIDIITFDFIEALQSNIAFKNIPIVITLNRNI